MAHPFTYPHTIDSDAGEAITFVRLVPDPAGEYVEVTNRVAPGKGPPMHVHHLQEEALTVQSGSLAYQRLGEEPQYAAVGETVVFPAGVTHRFWNVGQDELRCTGYVKPAHNIVYFLTGIYNSTKRNGASNLTPLMPPS